MINQKNIKKKATNKPSFIKISIASLIIGLIVGFFIGFLSEPFFYSEIFNSKNTREYTETRAGGYKFINPLLECDNFKPTDTRRFLSMKKDLNGYIDEALNNKIVNHISLYYRDLNNGPWFGINEKHNYTPASLLKVPILIAVLKKAEEDTAFLNMKITYTTPTDTIYTQNIGHDERLIIGQTYTIQQLIEYMIIYSDNNAKELLIQNVGDAFFVEVFNGLGIDLANRDLSIDFITVKEYSSFFRILYNASYLNRKMSEKALELLSRTKYNDGIPKKLPKGTLVSHKFGERGFLNSNDKQLHDCGIVYLQEAPYLICIMTKGSDFEKLKNTIADLSEIVYNNVSSK